MKVISIAALAGAIALSGCLNTATNQQVRALSYQEVTQAIPIGSSKDHVTKVLGKPTNINSFNGEERWAFVDAQNDLLKGINPFNASMGFNNRGIIVTFNLSGRVKRVDQTSFNL